MGELIVSLLTVLTAFVIHLAIWKLRLPKLQTRMILLIFFGTLCVTILTLPYLSAGAQELGISLSLRLAGYLHIAGFVISLTLAYMITYSAIEVDSPSLVMALTISKAGPGGLSDAEFQAMMNNALLVEPRIRDMLRDGLIRRDREVYRLTRKGERMARLFAAHRLLLGAGKGG